jgi:glutamate N-acetyltransferase/amino-acid N-acetyltransferase
MLAFLFTDAHIEPSALRASLDPAVDETFNAVTIDSDTSTSDTLLIFATGRAITRGTPLIAHGDDPRLAMFRFALHEVMRDLALQIVKDGEGLTKFVTVKVQGAESKEAARRIAKSIANSPLVKTAIAGEDPNWGRIVAAVGKGRRGRQSRPHGHLARRYPGCDGGRSGSGLSRGPRRRLYEEC